MQIAEIGQPTHHTRVQRWECDYNDHWNLRFYGRSFQMAAESIATPRGGKNPGAALIRSRHMRFHRELFESASFAVRTASLDGGPLDGALLHVMVSGGELAATAIDLPGGVKHLPRVTPGDVVPALPRGLAVELLDEWPVTGSAQVTVDLGPVQPSELDHMGELRFEQLVQHVAIASQHQLEKLGFTAAFSKEYRISRMVVEARYTRGTTPAAGTPLHAVSKLIRIENKNFWTDHRTLADTGEMVATIEQCLVTVDLNARRAVSVPDFLVAAVG